MFGCCCTCEDGGTVSRWLNSTLVRPVGDCTSGGTHYTVAPYSRIDPLDAVNCAGTVCGACGGWLLGGDLKGLSAQVVQDAINDIAPPPANDTTHAAVDHNTYLKSGTVDMRSKRRGGRWVLGRKFWHGAFGWKSNDACDNLASFPPDQTKYLKFEQSAAWNCSAAQWYGGATAVDSGNYSGSSTVNRFSGITVNTLSITQDASLTAGGSTTVLIRNRNGVGFDATGGSTVNYAANMVVQNNSDVRFMLPAMHNIGDFYCVSANGPAARIYSNGGFLASGLDSSGAFFSTLFPIVGTVDNWTCSGSVDCFYNPSNDGVTWVKLGTTTVNFSFSRTNTAIRYSYNATICDYV